MPEMDGEKWLNDGNPFEVIDLDSKRPVAEEEQVCMNAHDYNELMDAWVELYGEEYEHTGCLKEVENG